MSCINRKRMTMAQLFTRLLIAGIGVTGGAQTLDSADAVLDVLERNTENVEDYSATIFVDTYSDDGQITLTQEIELLLLQPDKMKQVFREPEYFAGNETLIAGDSMWTYIAAIDMWYTKDLSDLSTAEQPWVLFRQILRDSESEFDDYAFELMSFADGTYFLRGTPSSEDAAYGAVELWVPEETFLPVRRRLYDVDGVLLIDAQITQVERIDDTAYVALRVETSDEAGVLQSVIRYEDVRLNAGLDPALFTPPDVEIDE